MGFIKFTKGTSLSDKDRKSLQKLLTGEKKKLQSALKDVDASLSMLGARRRPRRRSKDSAAGTPRESLHFIFGSGPFACRVGVSHKLAPVNRPAIDKNLPGWTARSGPPS